MAKLIQMKCKIAVTTNLVSPCVCICTHRYFRCWRSSVGIFLRFFLLISFSFSRISSGLRCIVIFIVIFQISSTSFDFQLWDYDIYSLHRRFFFQLLFTILSSFLWLLSLVLAPWNVKSAQMAEREKWICSKIWALFFLFSQNLNIQLFSIRSSLKILCKLVSTEAIAAQSNGHWKWWRWPHMCVSKLIMMNVCFVFSSLCAGINAARISIDLVGQ